MANFKAVAVAQDVLNQLDTFFINTGYYVKSETFDFGMDSDLTDECKIDTIRSSKCEVCALGACFLAIAKNNYDLLHAFLHKSGDGYGYLRADVPLLRTMLMEYFDMESLLLIEYAFEGWVPRALVGDFFILEEKLAAEKRAAAFVKMYLSPAERLRAIMQNIITNDGHFIPGERT